MSHYTAVVPVAGAGTRLKPHTYTYPKVLLTVGDKPILGHIVDKLLNCGIKDICFVIGYLGEKVKDYIEREYGRKVRAFFVTQKEQKGLGHAVWLTRRCVKGPLLIILGDTIIDADIKDFLDLKIARLGVREVSDPRRFGIVEVSDDNFIVDMVEKPENPKTNLAISGIYSFPDSKKLYSALDEIIKSGIKTKNEYQLTDAMRLMVKRGYKMLAVKINGWYDCGKSETLLETNTYILSSKRLSCKIKGSVIIAPSYISPSARIKSSIIGPYVSIGDNARVENSIVSSSIVNEGAVIKNLNLSNSIIGPNAVLEGNSYSFNVGENSGIKIVEK
ncbi:MAG: sugar phosphate nucleotidyltransferase [Elusimicrobiales bacterium]